MPDIGIHEADSREKALDAVKNEKYDLILLDYSMPTMTGLDFLRDSKNIIMNTPIIMVTGTGNEEIAAKAFKMGVTDYLVKTNDLQQKVTTIVREILFSGGRDPEVLSVNPSSFESGIKVVKEYQNGLLHTRDNQVIKENIILEFDSTDDFNKFSRWALDERNINIKDIKIMEHKFIVIVTVSPPSYDCIK